MKKKSPITFLDNFTRVSWMVLLVVSLVQVFVWRSWPNLFAIGITLIAWLFVTSFMLKPYVVKRFPLSFFLILGFSATQFYLPPIFTLLEGKPVIYNLDVPYSVFVHSFAVLAVLIAAHLLYRFRFKNLLPKIRTLLAKGKLFTPPSDLQIWLMGWIGLAAMFYIYFYAPSAGIEIAGPVDKFIQGLIPFSYAPFLLPLGKLYGRSGSVSKTLIIQLALFFLVLLLVSLGRNSRGAFMYGFAAIGFAYFLGLLLQKYPGALFNWKKIVLAFAAVWLITGPLMDLGTAMVMVRGQRSDVTRTELLWKTIEVYQDEEALQNYREIRDQIVNPGLRTSEWDEDYLDNIFFARFANLKYNDNSLELAADVGPRDASFSEFTVNRFWSILPRPVLSFLNIDANKDQVNAVSFGDYLYFRGSGSKQALGGFRTGHFSGTGMAAFGWWYLLFLGISAIPLFFLLDLLVRYIPASNRSRFTAVFSLAGLLSITSVFMFFPTESIVSVFGFLIRGWIELVFLYWGIFHITRFLTRVKH